MASLKSDPDLQLPSQVGFNVGYLAYNTSHKLLDKVEVRQALDMAINKKAIIDSVYQGAGQAATNPMPPTQWSYDNGLTIPPHDPTKAKALLAKPGSPNAFAAALEALPGQ